MRILAIFLVYGAFIGAAFAESCEHSLFRFPAHVSTDARIAGAVAALQAKLSGRINIRVCETMFPIVPFVLLDRCWIILPEDFKPMASTEALSGQIAHEVAHCVLHKDKPPSNLPEILLQDLEADDEAARLVGRDAVLEGLHALRRYLEKWITDPRGRRLITIQLDVRTKRLSDTLK